jgi:protein O-mannosyl-transferase
MSVNAGIMNKKKERLKGKRAFGENLLRFPFAYLVIFLLIFIVYAQSLFFSLGKLDETNIILNNLGFLSDFRNLKEAFLTNPFFNKGGDFYRPLQNLSFMIDAHLSGQNGWAYYLSNILIHFVTCSLIFYLLNLFGKDRRTALLLTLLYAVHPLFVQTVAWAPSRGDLLLTMFGTGSFIFFIHYIRKRKAYFLLLHVLFFGLALFSKETAVIIPVICFLYYFFIEKEKKVRVSGLILPGVFFLLIFLGFMYIRNDVVRIVVQKGQFGPLPFLVHARTIPEFIAKFFFPVGLGPMPAFNLFLTALGLIIIAVLSWVSARSWSVTGRIFLFGMGWFLLFIIPALMYINRFGSAACDYMEHRAYLPLIGILILVYALLTRIPDAKYRKIYTAILLILIPVFGFYSFIYSRNYKTPMTYYDLAVSNNPASAISYFNRGATRMNFEKDYTGAIKDYEQTMALFPDYAESYINRGFCREQMKDMTGAVDDYGKAARLKPGWYEPHVNLATVKQKMGLFLEAILEYDTVLMFSPLFYQGYNERGSLKTEVKDYRGAMEDLNKAINMHETYPEAFFNRGVLELKLEDTRSAMEDFNKAIVLNDKYPEALVNRGILKYQVQDFTGAQEDFNRAISIDDRYAEAYLDRGMTRYMINDITGACEDWKMAEKLGLPDAGKFLEQYCRN